MTQSHCASSLGSRDECRTAVAEMLGLSPYILVN